MTPRELAEKTTKELLIAFKNKARCIHSEAEVDKIYREISLRFKSVGKSMTDLERATWHLQRGEGDAEFNEVCDNLINLFK